MPCLFLLVYNSLDSLFPVIFLLHLRVVLPYIKQEVLNLTATDCKYLTNHKVISLMVCQSALREVVTPFYQHQGATTPRNAV